MDLDFSKLNFNKNNIDLVIYHGSKCPDGFCSASIIYLYTNSDKKIKYYKADFNEQPPDVKNKNVVMCDFSYKKDVMKKIISDAKSFIVLDHHVSNEIELSEVSDSNKIFNSNYSGAYITWKYFFPDNEVPLLVQYVQDNDIWKKELENTREITAYIGTLDMKYEEWCSLMKDDSLIKDKIREGTTLLKQNDIYINDCMRYASCKFVQFDDEKANDSNGKYYFVASVNSSNSVINSDIGNKLLSKFPHCDFSCVYTVLDSSTKMSLRSDYNRTDVSQLVSKKLQGGGHRNASGCLVYNTTELGKFIDVDASYEILTNTYTGAYTIDNYDIYVAYLNTSHNKRPFGKYLLQNRYYDDKRKKNVQQATFIMKSDLYYHVSCTWNYDGKNTWFSVFIVNDSSNKELIQKLCDKFRKEDNYSFIESDTRIIFSRKSLYFLL